MTDIKKPVKERLYLDRGQREVYVDTCDLAQHQIEGIRFLYRQYIKKKPGVILNNPDGYGKSIQLAFFLDAIRELLTNPVLILCEDENKVNNWKQTLIKRTKYTEDFHLSGSVFHVEEVKDMYGHYSSHM
ncbi:hypothetical protein RR46_00246 [Papilio xuthus]|uniref:Uncharacterized protein n=1 Tax=Papilio xuthus TaxID=66420 RepID=A0A0N1ID83_PAPXU|nr:hypothetical protein RR46_00246 [Papilio xuthus]